jgi:hypothetical protein
MFIFLGPDRCCFGTTSRRKDISTFLFLLTADISDAHALNRHTPAGQSLNTS